MVFQASQFDWNQAKSFLATAEQGSLSAAARTLGLTQPTLSRQVAALETALGVTLFERSGRTPVLTTSGLELLEHVRGMGDAANRMSIAASGQAQSIAGQVSVTASEAVAAYQLPRLLPQLRELAPDIELEIVASNAIQDLQRREADIAIRHVRPSQPDLIARLICETPGYLYASTDYIEAFGRPRTPDDLSNVAVIGYENAQRTLGWLAELGLPLQRSNVCCVSTSGVACWEMVKQGLGIGIMTENVARLTPGVEAVLPQSLSVQVPVWLVTHRELHTSRRIRLVFDWLAEVLS